MSAYQQFFSFDKFSRFLHMNRRVRRIYKSPDPLEEQRRKELQQGESGTGGIFG